MMTRPSTIRKMPSQKRISGILDVGFRSKVRLQLSGFSDMSALTKRTDLGITGVQVFNILFP